MLIGGEPGAAQQITANISITCVRMRRIVNTDPPYKAIPNNASPSTTEGSS